MSDRRPLPGKFVWFELASTDLPKARAFYGEVLGWKAMPFPVGNGTYEMIFAGETPDTMVGGYIPVRGVRGVRGIRGDGQGSQWIASVSVDDVDAAAIAAAASGGTVVEPPHDLPGVGRAARIADPDGAALAVFKSASGDPPDVFPAPPGRFIWNELHTTDPEKALAFYESVVGFSSRSVPSPAGPYHILSRGGVDRGGITSSLRPGTSPHWQPVVSVADVDSAVARARNLGARISVQPEDMPGIGRLAVLEDPTGAVLALMKPAPGA